MPTNLPPEYFHVEKRYRTARAPTEKLACIEEMLTIIAKHKGTDKLRADLRRRVSKLKSAAETKKSIARHESVYHINKEGAGQVMIVGATNVGKSALVAALTHAAPEGADFPHTTWKPSPGMMPVENIQIQLIDTPPLSREYFDPEMMDLIRRCDLVLLMLDLQTDPLQQFEDTVALLEENQIVPLRFKDRYMDRRGNCPVPFLIMANKNDDAATDENLDIFRVYSKSPGKKPDLSSPFVLKTGSTIADFAAKVHQDFATKLRSAKVWGSSAFDGQMVQWDYVLQDGDVVELQI